MDLSFPKGEKEKATLICNTNTFNFHIKNISLKNQLLCINKKKNRRLFGQNLIEGAIVRLSQAINSNFNQNLMSS